MYCMYNIKNKKLVSSLVYLFFAIIVWAERKCLCGLGAIEEPQLGYVYPRISKTQVILIFWSEYPENQLVHLYNLTLNMDRNWQKMVMSGAELAFMGQTGSLQKNNIKWNYLVIWLHLGKLNHSKIICQ